MAYVVALCGEKMTMSEFVRHIPRCARCAAWWMTRKTGDWDDSRSP